MAKAIPFERFPFVGPSNLSVSPYIDAERSINLYYEPAYAPPGMPASAMPALVGTPGLSAPLASPVSGAVTNVSRGLYAGNQRLFGAVGNHFYEFNLGFGGILTDFGAFAGDAGTDGRLCTIVGGTAAPMLLVHNPASKQTYFVNAASVDSKFNSLALTYLDGFFVTIATGASLSGTNPNQVNASAFNDGTTWPALAFVIKEGSADAINQLANVNNLLWIFGQQNIEIWYNAGLPNFPFARVNGGTLNVGCLAPLTVVNIGNRVMWLGASQRGWGTVYINNGYREQRVSTAAIEALINSNLNTSLGIGQSSAFAIEEAGHQFYCLNLKWNAGATTLTLVYDLTTNLWHERAYYSNGTLVPWLPICAASVQAAPNATYVKTFVGDRQSGNIYQVGQQYTNDNGTAIWRQRTCSHISESLNWTRYAAFEVHADIGTAQMTMFYSNNGGKTFPALNRPDATKSASNDQGVNSGGGTYPRFRWMQLGRSRKRTMGISILDGNNPISIAQGVLSIAA